MQPASGHDAVASVWWLADRFLFETLEDLSCLRRIRAPFDRRKV